MQEKQLIILSSSIVLIGLLALILTIIFYPRPTITTSTYPKDEEFIIYATVISSTQTQTGTILKFQRTVTDSAYINNKVNIPDNLKIKIRAIKSNDFLNIKDIEIQNE